MNPIIISAIIRSLNGLKRICPVCHKSQVVSSHQKELPVRCKFCGGHIPARSLDKY